MNSADFLIVLTVAISTALLFIRVLAFGPSDDGTEFARASWLVAHGEVMYRDFFQNHSPWYILLTGHLFDTNSPYLLLDLSLLHWLAAIVAAGALSWITWLEAAPETAAVRRRSSLVAFLGFLTLSPVFVGEPLRPETLCLATLVMAGLCGKLMGGANGPARWPLAIGFAFGIGLSICFSPRALVLGLAIIAWVASENRGRGAWLRLIVALAAAAAILLAIVAPFVSLADVFHWFIVFNGDLERNQPLADYTTRPRARYSVVAMVVTALIVVVRLSAALLAGKFRSSTMLTAVAHDRRLAGLELCLAASWLYLYVDRRWAAYSLDFIVLAATSWMAIAGIHLTRALSGAPRFIGLPTAAGLLGFALLWNFPNFLLGGVILAHRTTPAIAELNKIDLPHLGDYLDRLVAIGHPQSAPISADMLKPEPGPLATYAGWLEWSKQVCAAAGGQTALFFTSRPACLTDPSYFWVRWPTLPTSDLAADIRNAKPVIIEKTCPENMCGDMAPIGDPGDGYVDAGWAWIRADLARRLTPSPKG